MIDTCPVKRHAWLRADLEASLAAIEFASAAARRAARNGNPDYSRGYADAITAMRLALGLPVAMVVDVDAD